jgi:hypothetical protein
MSATIRIYSALHACRSLINFDALPGEGGNAGARPE